MIGRLVCAVRGHRYRPEPPSVAVIKALSELLATSDAFDRADIEWHRACTWCGNVHLRIALTQKDG